MPPHSCSWRSPAGPQADGPLARLPEVCCVAAVGPCRPPRPQGRRASRVLYPPHLSRRPLPPREDPDPARRWLLLLTLLLFLQIYSEEDGQHPELSSQTPTPAEPWAQVGEGCLGTPVVPLPQDGEGCLGTPVVPLPQDGEGCLGTPVVPLPQDGEGFLGTPVVPLPQDGEGFLGTPVVPLPQDGEEFLGTAWTQPRG
ncbi:hypothetical protein NHX12_028406 [Muraenolepis orangiensis]|uniref:Uncharacterized protein n=1 Tax=Muraenolepis orangiensis TaxID=630683 RepID=A0A9Q0EFU7_9TELE|nr:hypothetical protein NHX12_028406 [Muraenolepis orangiensis]